jgi:hypothetical protein
VVLHDGKIESLTDTPDLPLVETELNGLTYRSADVLVRN